MLYNLHFQPLFRGSKVSLHHIMQIPLVSLVGQCYSLVLLNEGLDSVSQQGDDTSTIDRSDRDKHTHLLDAINVIQSAHIPRVNLAQY